MNSNLFVQFPFHSITKGEAIMHSLNIDPQICQENFSSLLIRIDDNVTNKIFSYLNARELFHIGVSCRMLCSCTVRYLLSNGLNISTKRILDLIQLAGKRVISLDLSKREFVCKDIETIIRSCPNLQAFKFNKELSSLEYAKFKELSQIPESYKFLEFVCKISQTTQIKCLWERDESSLWPVSMPKPPVEIID